MMSKTLLILFSVLLVGCLPTGVGRKLYTSPSFPVDQPIAPSQALAAGGKFIILEDQPGELIWLRGLSARVVDEAGNGRSDEFQGYSTLDFYLAQWHNEKFGTTQSSRLFGFGNGVSRIQFPTGFGLALKSNEPLWLTTRVVNPFSDRPNETLQQKVSLDFVRERGLETPMRPLLARAVTAAVGENLEWKVPSGGSSVRTDITASLGLLAPTRLHAATLWLERYGRRVVLRDTTLGADLLTLEAETSESGRISSLQSFSSEEGVLLDPAHRYEIETSYTNPTSQSIRGVGYLMFYVHDSNFRKPAR